MEKFLPLDTYSHRIIMIITLYQAWDDIGAQGLGFHNPSTTVIDVIKHLSGPGKLFLKVEDIVFKFSQRVPHKMSSQINILYQFLYLFLSWTLFTLTT